MSEFFNAIDVQDEENIRRQAMMICDALYNKKAQDIMAIHVGDRTIIAGLVCGMLRPGNGAGEGALRRN